MTASGNAELTIAALLSGESLSPTRWLKTCSVERPAEHGAHVADGAIRKVGHAVESGRLVSIEQTLMKATVGELTCCG